MFSKGVCIGRQIMNAGVRPIKIFTQFALSERAHTRKSRKYFCMANYEQIRGEIYENKW